MATSNFCPFRNNEIDSSLTRISVDAILLFLSIACSLILCIFIYKILNNILPVSLRNKIEIVGNMNQRQMRQAGNIVMGFRKITSAQKSVFYEG